MFTSWGGPRYGPRYVLFILVLKTTYLDNMVGIFPLDLSEILVLKKKKEIKEKSNDIAAHAFLVTTDCQLTL